MSITKKQSRNVKQLVLLALFCALAYATTLLIHIKVLFLTFDAKDAIITLAGLLFGPLSSLVISLVVSSIEAVSISDTQFWGFLMNFLSSAVFSCTAALIYKFKRSIKGAVIGLTAAVFVTTAVMMILNLLITPIYTGQTTAEIASAIPTLLFPFNLTKSVLNMALVLILYKPVSRALKAARLTSGLGEDQTRAKKSGAAKTSIAVTLLGLVLVAVSVVVFIFVLGGKIEF